jgi:pimeloyl-ACP methyl ester carboxylesterase
MPVMKLKDGTNIAYEVLGSGPPVVLIGGGRRAKEWIKPLAERIAQGGYQVIIHDRRNCGVSDVVIERRVVNGQDLSEQEIWVDELAELLGNLGVLPVWVGGTSAGCRVSLLMAIRHPEAVKGLLLWRVTGGEHAARSLGYDYYDQFVEVAEKEGMAGVIKTPFFAERIEQNASNRERLLKMDVKDFIAVMKHWRTFFTAEHAVLGTSEQDLRKIKVPTTIIAGADDIHPTMAAQKLHEFVAGSEYHPPQWNKEESDYLLARQEEYAKATAEKVPPVILSFLAKHEPAAARA